MSPSRQVVVVGAGISGVACALRLRGMGFQVRVLEASDRPGGVVDTIERNGFLFESGPQSVQLTAKLREFARAAGCENELIEADPRTPRFVLLNGKLIPAPMSPPGLLTTSLLGVGSKMRLLTEPMRRTKAPEGDESLADFVRRKFGTEILDHLAGPFASGIFAGDPELMSLRSSFPSLAVWEDQYGSVLRGAIKSRGKKNDVRPTLAGFKHGMASLIAAAVRKLEPAVALGMRADKLTQEENGPWRIRCGGHGESADIHADALVLAAPAYETARLVTPLSRELASALGAIPYAPVAVVAEGYRREFVGHDLNGFGFLIPRKEGLHTLGTIWNSSLFPNRAPEGMVLMTSFVGGATDPKTVAQDPGYIANEVRDEIGRVLSITGPPIERQVWRHLRALPQYNLGHSQRVRIIREELSQLRGVFLAGNYLDGPSFGSCVAQANSTADAVRDFLAQ
ncbi:MAG TPA: protoporphyrinogen oxidase [Candidatus Acidoferrales bacterium]|nr:protoporphyrinogen oxidase [Candidatus Acidoferrales bacterium]HEV2341036.1 protoporphyrinogen oxidase [Candidatus Acidoferrales bacterium]